MHRSLAETVVANGIRSAFEAFPSAHGEPEKNLKEKLSALPARLLLHAMNLFAYLWRLEYIKNLI